MALIFVPFPVETKISGNFMSPNSSKENWFYPVCNSSFTLATGSHWIQQVTHLQTDGPTLPPQTPCRINIQKWDVKIVTNIQRAYKTIKFSNIIFRLHIDKFPNAIQILLINFKSLLKCIQKLNSFKITIKRGRICVALFTFIT